MTTEHSPAIKAYGDLDHFLELAERRLYRLLVVHGERKIARVENGEAMVAADAAISAHRLFMAARELRDGRP